MKSEHFSEDCYLDFLTGELRDDYKARVQDHVRACSKCQLRVKQYREILRDGLPSLADEIVDNPNASVLPWSLADGEKRLFATIDNEVGLNANDHLSRRFSVVRLAAGQGKLTIFSSPNLRAVSVMAASATLAISLGVGIYRFGEKRGLQESSFAQPSHLDSGTPKAQIDRLVRERDAVQESLRQRENLISEFRVQLKEQRKQTEALEENLRSVTLQAEQQTRQISSEREELARKLEDEQSVLGAAQQKVDTLQQAEANDAVRVVSLENQIQQMSQLFKDKNATIDEQQRMLAADRDIRDLMAARNLYIAEVYDVGGNGKKKKPYGRVFYTKGKSLIFYGYDLDQQPGLKNANAFQAWGLRGPDRNTAINLGVMYVDNSTNKRWVLRFDDPKALEEINAVFVTMEPNGGSRVPRGQQVLFAYLKEEPNHP